jgi:hypothetical protein
MSERHDLSVDPNWRGALEVSSSSYQKDPLLEKLKQIKRCVGRAEAHLMLRAYKTPGTDIYDTLTTKAAKEATAARAALSTILEELEER